MHLFAALSKRQGAPPPSKSSTTTATTSVLIKTPTRTPTSTGTSVPVATATAAPAANNNDRDNGSKSTYLIAIVAIAALIFAILFLFFVLRRARRKHKNPKYVPTPFLKKLWEKWEPAAPHLKFPRNNDHFEPISSATRRSGVNNTTAGSNGAAQNATSSNNARNGTGSGDVGTATVDRNTSVRSVMTLPAYRPNPHQNEQVLGREGERGGIDVVIEFPETVDEEERLREEEMEALYQVRLARRRENEERDERRRLRREARERGDYVALREIQARARASSAASAGRSVEELRAEHERLKKERNRAVSSVSYGDLGIARHDGTRLRANSEESERTGLLGDAASIAASSRYHRRDRSASSVLSIDTMNSDLPSPGFTRPRGDSRASRPESPFRRMSAQEGTLGNEGRAGSSPEMIDHEDAPPHSPPGYENISLDTPSGAATPQPPHHHEPPPDYTSPVLARGEARPMTESQAPSAEERTPSPSVGSRRSSAAHMGQLISDRGTSSSESAGSRSPNLQAARIMTGEGRTSTSPGRGVGGVPQLPSLKLSNLPSIQVDPGSPSVRRVDEERRPE